MSGGIHKFKQHVEHVSRDAKGCPNAPAEVRKQMRENLFGKAKKKGKKKKYEGGS